MKKSAFKTFTLLSTVMLAFVLISCESDEGNPFEDDLYGTWTLDKLEYEVQIGGVEAVLFLQNTYGFTQAQAEAYLDMFMSEELFFELSDLSGTLTFNTDYTYVAALSEEGQSEEGEEGEWSLSADGKLLTLQPSGNSEGSSEELEIGSLSADRLVINLDTEEIETEFNEGGEEETEVSVTISMVFSK